MKFKFVVSELFVGPNGCEKIKEIFRETFEKKNFKKEFTPFPNIKQL